MSLPTPRWKGWSVDSFIFARTAPPVDVVGAIEFTESIALYQIGGPRSVQLALKLQF